MAPAQTRGSKVLAYKREKDYLTFRENGGNPGGTCSTRIG